MLRDPDYRCFSIACLVVAVAAQYEVAQVEFDVWRGGGVAVDDAAVIRRFLSLRRVPRFLHTKDRNEAHHRGSVSAHIEAKLEFSQGGQRLVRVNQVFVQRRAILLLNLVFQLDDGA